MRDVCKIRFFSAVHPRFNAGQLYASEGIVQLGCPEHLRRCLGRHVRGDWGILEPEMVQRNELNLRARACVMSTYAINSESPCTRSENCVWIVTDLARNKTSFLLPSEI